MEQVQSWASAINANDVAMFIASVTKDNVNISQNINGTFYTPVQYLAKYGNTNSHQMLDHLLFLGADLSLKADAATLPVNVVKKSKKNLIEDTMNKCEPLNNKACVKIGTLSLFNPNLNEYDNVIILNLLFHLDQGKYIPNENSQNKEIIMKNAKKWKRSSWLPCLSKFSGLPWSEGCGVPGILHESIINYSPPPPAPAPRPNPFLHGPRITEPPPWAKQWWTVYGGKKSRKAKSRRSNKTKRRRNTPSA